MPSNSGIASGLSRSSGRSCCSWTTCLAARREEKTCCCGRQAGRLPLREEGGVAAVRQNCHCDKDHTCPS